MGEGATSVDIEGGGAIPVKPVRPVPDKYYLSPRNTWIQLWLAVVVGSAVVGFISDTFLWSFDSRVAAGWALSYTCDVIFVGHIMIRFFTAFYREGIMITSGPKIRQHYLTTTFGLDLVTCLPLELFAFVPSLAGPIGQLQLRYVAILRCNRLLRIYFMFSHFAFLESRLGCNVKTILSTKYFTIAGLLVHTMACCWYSLGCPGKHEGMDMHCYPNTWATSFNFYDDPSLNMTSTRNSYIIALYWATTTASSTGYGEFHPMTVEEKWFAILSMLMGITVFFGVILGGLASQLTNLDIQRSWYTHRMNIIDRHLLEHKIPLDEYNQITGYYEYLWHRRKGVSGEGLLDQLPITLHAEVAMEANKHILNSAPLFKDLDAGILRMLSLEFKQALFLPKQVICCNKDISSNMYYIQRGELEILSAEDEKHQMTLRCGELFGEVSLVKPMPKFYTIQAVAHCDLMSLEKHDLNSVLRHYPGALQHLQQLADLRIERAHQYELEHPEECREPAKEEQVAIEMPDSDSESDSGSDFSDSDMDLDVEAGRSATPGPALNEGLVEVHRPSVLFRLVQFLQYLKTTIVASVMLPVQDLRDFDGVFMPQSSLIKIWEYLLLAVTILVALVYPYGACFIANLYEVKNNSSLDNMLDRMFLNSNQPHKDTTTLIYVVMGICDFLIAMDLFVRLRTAHVTPNGTYKDFKSIREHYVKTWGFVLDLLALPPLQPFAFIYAQGTIRTSCVFILSLNRLIRVWRINNFFSLKEKDLKVNINGLRFVKIIIYIVLFTHWSACIWYLGHNIEGRYILETAEALTSTGQQYLLAIYWAAATMTSTGYGDIVPDSINGYLIAILVELGGFLVFGSILSITAATLTNNDAPRVAYLEKLGSTKGFMEENHLPLEIQERVVNAFILNFHKYQGVYTPGSHEPLMHDMPAKLQEDIAFFENKDFLKQFPLFTGCGEAFMRRLSLKMHTFQYSPGDCVITRGDVGQEMYFVRKGILEVLSSDEQRIIGRIQAGDFFGEVGLIFGEKRTVTVQAASNCELLVLNRDDLDKVLEDFSLIDKQLKEFATNTQIIADLKATIAAEEKSDNYVFEACREWNTGTQGVQKFKTKSGQLLPGYSIPFIKLGFVPRMLSKLLMQQTFLPCGSWVKYFEICRLTIAVVLGLCYLLLASLYHMSTPLWVICYVLDCMCIVDIYLKLHFAYYNENGTLISHPLTTAKNYLTSNFIFDLVAIFPMEIFAYASIRSFESEAVHIYALWRANRLLQLIRVPLAFNMMECNLKLNTGYVKEAKFFLYLIFFFHGLSCLWFIQACPPVGIGMHFDSTVSLESQGLWQAGDQLCYENTWAEKIDGFDSMSNGIKYCYSFYWAAATGAVVGYGDITADVNNYTEVIISVISMIFGILFFGYIVASVAASMANADAQRARYQTKLKGITSYLIEQDVSKSLSDRILKYYNYIWLRTKGVDPETLFEGLSPALSADVHVALYKDMIDKVPLFQGTGDSFQKLLATCITPVYYMDNEYVVRKHDSGDNMFFISRGAVDVVSEDGKVIFDTMKAGRFFGEISLFKSCHRTASIRASGNCDMFILKKDDLEKVLKIYPSIKEKVMEVADQRFNLVKQRSQARLKKETTSKPEVEAKTSALKEKRSSLRKILLSGKTESKIADAVGSGLAKVSSKLSSPAPPVKEPPEDEQWPEAPASVSVEVEQPAVSPPSVSAAVEQPTVSPPALLEDQRPESPAPTVEEQRSFTPPLEDQRPATPPSPVDQRPITPPAPVSESAVPSNNDVVMDVIDISDSDSLDNVNNSGLPAVETPEKDEFLPPHFYVEVMKKNPPQGKKAPEILQATQIVPNAAQEAPGTSQAIQIAPTTSQEDVPGPSQATQIVPKLSQEAANIVKADDKTVVSPTPRVINVQPKSSQEQCQDNNNASVPNPNASNNNSNDGKDDGKDVETEPAVPFHQRLLARNRFVVPPSSFKLRVLRNITCLLAYLTSLTTIFQFAYQYQSDTITAFSYLCELVFIFEIYVKLHATVRDKFADLETDFVKVYKVYLKNPEGFAVDCAGTIPFEFFAVCAPPESRFAVYTILRLNRLIRLFRVFQYFSNWEKELDINMLKVRLTKMLFVISIVIHICASIWYAIACPLAECTEGSWAEVQGYLNNDRVVTTFERFTDSVYWCVATLTSTGYGDMKAITSVEMVFAGFTMIIGQLLVGSVLGNIASTLANRDTARVDFEKQLLNVKRDMDERKLDKALITRVFDYFDYAWIRNKGVQQHDLFRDAPFCLQTDLFMEVYGEQLRRLPLFDGVSDGFLRAISVHLDQTLAIPGDEIVKQGDVGTGVYIIHNGMVEVCQTGTDEPIDILGDGAFFDEINLLSDLPRKHTVRAVTHVDAITLSMESLAKVMINYPEDAKKIMETAHLQYGLDAHDFN